MPERPFKYEQCSECIVVAWMWSAKNERGFCSGIVKEPNPKCDVVRFCLLEKKVADTIDLSVSEAFDIAAVMATAASQYLRKIKKSPDW